MSIRHGLLALLERGPRYGYQLRTEFETRTDGIPGLKKVYGLTFKSFSPLDESGPITLSALQNGKVQAADVFTTTPQIITDKLLSLSDPKNMFAAQNVLPLVYKKAASAKVVSRILANIRFGPWCASGRQMGPTTVTGPYTIVVNARPTAP